MWVSCRIKSDSHTLSGDAFRLFQIEEMKTRIGDVRQHDFLVSLRDGDPESAQVHDCHRVISALLVALNVGALGSFYWAQDPWVHPVYTVVDDLDGKNSRSGALVVQSNTRWDELRELSETDVMNVALVFGIIARERTTALTGEYCRGLLLLRMNFAELNFHREAFMCFYRALEHFVANRLLKVKRLENELRELQRGLSKLTSDKELINELKTIYKVRSTQGAHSQVEQREITFDEVMKVKVFLDFVMHKEFKDEANKAMTQRTGRSGDEA